MATIHNQRELGAAVRDRRTNLGWTQVALAGKVGVTRDWVIDMEAGRGNPQLRNLLRALDILGLRLAVEPDANNQDATLDRGRGAEAPELLVHRGLPVVNLDEILDAHRHRG